MTSGDLLFYSKTHDLHQVIRNQEAAMLREIDAYNGDQLLNTSIEDLCDYFVKKFEIEPLLIRDSEITASQREVDIDVSNDPLRDIRDKSRPFYLKGTSISFHIPFEGDVELFHCRPSQFSLNPPRGKIVDSEVIVTYESLQPDAGRIKDQFNRELSQIKSSVDVIQKDLTGFNDRLRGTARGRIEWRRDKLLKDRGLVESLGFPLQQRGSATPTFIPATVKRKATPVKPTASKSAFKPEPTLDMENYEHILSVIMNMVQVMERSPQAFAGMKEEDLRQHFLVQLNGHYEGQATGETFNFDGKTDILIRAEGRNVFIAECKFWRGEKSLINTIDQLLGYTSWRDTKTAIILFNRDREFSSVVKQIKGIVEKHSNFKRLLEYRSETGFRFMLHHRDDKNRELILTVLLFEVPG